MKLFAGFWKWLTTKKVRQNDVGNPDMQVIDLKQLAVDLNLRTEAKRLGIAGIPRTDAKELTGPEANVVQAIEIVRHQYVSWASRRCTILNENIARRDVTSAVNRTLGIDGEFRNEAKDHYSNGKAILDSLKEVAKRSRQELDEFCERNQLTREAVYPTGPKSFFLYMLLSLLVIIEGAVNGVYFAEGNSNGILGGMANAAMFALINVMVAYLNGRFLVRQLFRVQPLRRVVGYVSCVLFIVTTSAIALLIAHVRQAFVSGAEAPQQVGFDTMVANPFGISGSESIILIALSIFFALVALWDGISADDKYPEFGDITRRARKSEEILHDEVQGLREGLIDLRQSFLDALTNQVQSSQVAVSLIAKDIDFKEITEARLSQALQDVTNSMDALLKEFRTENEVHRGSTPVPPYFGLKHQLSAIALPNFDTTSDRMSLKVQEELVARLIASESKIRLQIQQTFEVQMLTVEGSGLPPQTLAAA